jgi:hypothetical protein
VVHWYPPEHLNTGQATVNYRNRPELIPLPDENAPWPWKTPPEPAGPAGDSPAPAPEPLRHNATPEKQPEPEPVFEFQLWDPEPFPPDPPEGDITPGGDIEELVFEFQRWGTDPPTDPPDTPSRRVITDEEFLAAWSTAAEDEARPDAEPLDADLDDTPGPEPPEAEAA